MSAHRQKTFPAESRVQVAPFLHGLFEHLLILTIDLVHLATHRDLFMCLLAFNSRKFLIEIIEQFSAQIKVGVVLICCGNLEKGIFYLNMVRISDEIIDVDIYFFCNAMTSIEAIVYCEFLSNITRKV